MRLRLGPQADSERVPLLSIALVNCTIGTLGPTVELFNENGNVVHPRWHSQPNDSESELSDSEACAARQFHVAAKLQIEFSNGVPPWPVAHRPESVTRIRKKKKIS